MITLLLLMTFTWKFFFIPSTAALFMGNKNKAKQAVAKNTKATQRLHYAPTQIYSTSVTVCKSVDWLLRERRTTLPALHHQQQFLSPPQSYHHGGYQLLHEDPLHLFMVPSESLPLQPSTPASRDPTDARVCLRPDDRPAQHVPVAEGITESAFAWGHSSPEQDALCWTKPANLLYVIQTSWPEYSHRKSET